MDESSVLPLASSNSETVNGELKAIVMEGERKPDEFLVVPLESVYSEVELDVTGTNGAVGSSRQKKLQMLFQSVADPTGKEDLLQHLRMQALQQVAKDHGYTRLVLGLSTSRIAAKVISATAKGCGFSLPTEMQFYDARWNVPVVLPLRDCVIKELVLLCHLRHLKYVFIPTLSTLSMPQNTINSLSASFVSLLQEDNPSKERTIMRTAAKLQPFSFNRPSSYESSILHKRSSHSPISNGVHVSEDEAAEALCPVCCAPLNQNESMSLVSSSHSFEHKRWQGENLESHVAPMNGSSSRFINTCCPSCQFQILGGNACNETQHLLPQLMKRSEMVNSKMKEMWMRSQISDCLLSDSDCDE